MRLCTAAWTPSTGATRLPSLPSVILRSRTFLRRNGLKNTPIQGAEAIWDFFVEAQDAWEEGPYEFGELIDAGKDKIVVNQLRGMRGKTSGARVAWSFWVVLTFRDGRVLRWEWFADRGEALKAAGLSQ